MPTINRIRMSNVYFNDGNNFYDDFRIDMGGYNTLIDLKNGQGKSLFVQLMSQTMYPGAKTDEHHSFSDLFDDQNNNKALHVLIEWELDKGSPYKYLLTGLCGFKKDTAASNSDDELGDGNNSSYGTIRYTCFYNEPNEYDIFEIPLVTETADNQKKYMTRTELKRFLNNIQSKNLANYDVKIHSLNREYLNLLASFNINKVEWELLTAVCRDGEGKTNTYFRRYKTAKDFILDFLIQMIESSYSFRADGAYQTSENRADTLIRLKETLSELHSKEETLGEFITIEGFCEKLMLALQRLIEAHQTHEADIVLLSELKEKVNRLTAINIEKIKETDEILLTESEKIERLEQLIRELSKSLEELNILEVELEAEELARKSEKQKEIVSKYLSELETRKDYLERMENEQDYREIEVIEQELHLKHEEKTALSKDNQELLTSYEYWGNVYANKFSYVQDKERKRERTLSKEVRSIQDNLGELRVSKRVLENGIADLIKQIGNKEGTLNKLQLDLSASKSSLNYIERSALEKDISKNIKDIEEEINHRKTLSKQLDEITNIKSKKQGIIKEHLNRIEIIKVQKDNILDTLNKHDSAYRLVEQVSSKYPTDTPMQFVTTELAALNNKGFLLNADISALQHKLVELQQDSGISLSRTARFQYELISSKYTSAIMGQEYLKDKSVDEKKSLLSICEILPYAIVVNEYDFKKINEDISLRRKFKDEIVPIINSSSLKDQKAIRLDNLLFTNKDPEYFINIELRLKEIERINKELEVLKGSLAELKNTILEYEQDLDVLKTFDLQYKALDVPKMREELNAYSLEEEKLLSEFDELNKLIQQLQVQLDEITLKIRESENKENTLLKEEEYLSKQLKVFNQAEILSEQVYEIRAAIDKLRQEKDNGEVTIKETSLDISKQEAILETKTNELSHVKQLIIEKDTVHNYNLKGFNALNNDKKYLNDPVTYDVACDNFLFYKERLNKEAGNLSAIDTEINKLKDSINQVTERMNSRSKTYTREFFEMANDLYSGKYNEHIWSIRQQIKESEKAHRIESKALAAAERLASNIEGKLTSIKNMFYNKYKVSYERPILEDYSTIASQKDILINSIQFNRTTLGESRTLFETKQKLREELRIESMQLENDFGKIKEIIESNKYEDKIQIVKIKDLDISRIGDISKRLADDRRNIDLKIAQYKGTLVTIQKTMQQANLVNFKTELYNLEKHIPQTLNECIEIIDKIYGDNGYIQTIREEKERTSKVIEELKGTEEHFITHCLQKCKQIDEELKNIEKLSTIELRGEKRRMIKINIPSIDEVNQKAKMKNYITHVLKSMEEYNDTEKQRYLTEKLSMKQLYCQYVLNINRADVQIYKVEDSEEASRYLNWHKAAGSTGQSNGMYIGVFICIISYIRQLYNPHVGESSKKFIFFDNPFSGTTALYIWEPLIKLIEENNVQFFSVSTEVPQGVLPLFDVQYYLKSKMLRNNKTVVVEEHFKSSVLNRERLHYKKFKGEQISML